MKNFTLIGMMMVLIIGLTSCLDLVYEEPPEPSVPPPGVEDPADLPAPEINIPHQASYTDAQITIEWIGGPASIANRLEYRYKINEEPFSDWSTSLTSVTRLFDEGQQTLLVEARYADRPPESPNSSSDRSVSFGVNAVSGPSVMMRPRFTQTVNRNQIFEVFVWMEELSNVSSSDVHISYDNSKLQLLSSNFVSGNIMDSRAGASILYPQNSASATGQLSFTTAFYGNPPPTVQGSGLYARMSFSVRPNAPSGTTRIEVTPDTQVRNPQNNNVLNQRIHKDIVIP